MAAGDVTTAETVDLAAVELRALNARLHQLAGGEGPRRWRVLNPAAGTASPRASTPTSRSRSTGHVGYYCAGMNQRATVRVHGNAGVGLAENMMSGWSWWTATRASRRAPRRMAACS